jgi:hypothetical protein
MATANGAIRAEVTVNTKQALKRDRAGRDGIERPGGVHCSVTATGMSHWA